MPTWLRNAFLDLIYTVPDALVSDVASERLLHLDLGSMSPTELQRARLRVELRLAVDPGGYYADWLEERLDALDRAVGRPRSRR